MNLKAELDLRLYCFSVNAGVAQFMLAYSMDEIQAKYSIAHPLTTQPVMNTVHTYGSCKAEEILKCLPQTAGTTAGKPTDPIPAVMSVENFIYNLQYAADNLVKDESHKQVLKSIISTIQNQPEAKSNAQ
jgi:hypothetical protein